MALIHAEMKLSDIILNDNTLIPVINRFGIHLGLGDKSVRTICEEMKLDTDFFLSILNTFINEEYFPERKLQSFCATKITAYLTLTNAYYDRFQVPNIEHHLNSFIERSSPSKNLELIRKFFLEFKTELKARIEYDRTTWFPSIRILSEKLKSQDFKLVHFPIEADLLEEKLYDMKSIMVKHLGGDFDENLCYAVIFSLDTLEKDIRQHNRIRHRILEPMTNAMTETFNTQCSDAE